MPDTQHPVTYSPSKKRGVSLDGEVATIGVSESGHVFGTNNPDIIEGIAGQIINVASKGAKPDAKAVAFMSAMIGSIHPKDTIEAMLAAQMAAVHNATMFSRGA
jgi:hypothetical protein